MAKSESPFPAKTDFFTKHGAGLLADHITQFWANRGYKRVYAERHDMGGGAWGVRSNLINGLPPAR